MDTIAAYFAYLLLQVLNLLGLNVLAIKISSSLQIYFQCLTRNSLYSTDLTIHDACYEFIPLGYATLLIVAVAGYLLYRKLKR